MFELGHLGPESVIDFVRFGRPGLDLPLNCLLVAGELIDFLPDAVFVHCRLSAQPTREQRYQKPASRRTLSISYAFESSEKISTRLSTALPRRCSYSADSIFAAISAGPRHASLLRTAQSLASFGDESVRQLLLPGSLIGRRTTQWKKMDQ